MSYMYVVFAVFSYVWMELRIGVHVYLTVWCWWLGLNSTDLILKMYFVLLLVLLTFLKENF
jgi:hypothetical protein